MLLTTLLAQHPEAITDIVRQTPLWVAGVLAGLTALGLWAARTRQVHFNRLVAMPLVMGGLALWGVQSAFGASGRLAELLALWAACCAALLALGTRLAPPVGAAYDAATRSFRLPGSWVPMGLILVVFLMKYGIGVQLALEPTLARAPGFAFAVTALYGLLSGLFAARTLRVWWGFSWWEGRQRAGLEPYQTADGELVIPRSPDGHFHIDGEVNHEPVRFMVDTGASSVAVSTRLARRAQLPEGRRVTVSTANGTREARLIHGVPVKAGPLARNDVTVTTGLDMGGDDGALLGQSFLRQFDVRIEANRLLLRSR